MRDFFKYELGRLHLTAGLQQNFKLSDAEITELLDLLCAKCAQFHNIPDDEKQKYIRQCMETDSDFLGFNAKILHKWLNILNRGYIHTQSEYQETEWVPPTPDQQAKIDGLLKQWKIDMMKIGDPAPRVDGIKDVRIQQMKEQFQGIECKHTGLRVPISDTAEVCNDCGKEFETGAADSPVEPTK